MNPESENFDSLRRLLALKRHEQPPPGYFNRFSTDVIARIEAGEARGPAWANLIDAAPWLQNFWRALEGKPVFVGLFGAAVCGLLVTGILRSEQPEPAQPMAVVGTDHSLGVGDGAAAILANTQPAIATPVAFTSSTNPVASGTGSLFDQVQLPTAQPASQTFIYSGNP